MPRSVPAALAILCCAAPPVFFRAAAQAIPASQNGKVTTSATNSDSGPAGIVPYIKGPNLSLEVGGQHDSSNGWASLLTPDFAWRFNRNWSADANVPLYDYINTIRTTGTAAHPVYTRVTRRFASGDTALNGHFEASPRLFDYDLTATLGLPSGEKSLGLGAGKVTYNVNNHFEHELGIFVPDIELGIGDSSALDDSRVRKSFVSVGELAHFQAGTAVELPRFINFSADAYEDMPLTRQTIYSTTGKGKKKVTTETSKSIGEDNGFLTTLDIPLNPHITLSGFYNRSLRNHIDTAGASLTFFLRGLPHLKAN